MNDEYNFIDVNKTLESIEKKNLTIEDLNFNLVNSRPSKKSQITEYQQFNVDKFKKNMLQNCKKKVKFE